MQIPEAVRDLERDLRGVFGTRLQSLVAYGAPGHAHAAARTMALVTSLTEQDLRGCAARVAAWHAAGLATPLVLAADEFAHSLDAFPLEFAAILADHTVVAGAEPFDHRTIEAGDLRRACEVQARSHLLHLRQGFVEASGNGNALAILIVESAAPLGALLTSVARLEGRSPGDAAAAGRHVERLLGATGGSIADIAALAHVHEIPAADAERLFSPYLAAMERLVTYVDGWGDT
jgi:hypothetical protein